MNQHPFFMDLVFAVAFLPVLEVALLRKNYKILSPVTIFAASTLYLYVVPYFAHFYIAPNWRIAALDHARLSLAFNTLRCFIYTFYIVLIPLIIRASKREPKMTVCNNTSVGTRMFIVFLLLFIVTVIKLGVGVGFSPISMLDRAVNPRAYTHIRVGLGPLHHLHISLKYVLLTLVSVKVFETKKSIGAIFFLVLSVILTLLGGTKASFVLPFIVFVIVWQKVSFNVRGSFYKFRKTMLICLLVASVVIVSFAVWGAPGQVVDLQSAVQGTLAYQREAFYLPLVIQAFDWSPKVITQSLYDTAIAPIPRAMWRGKPAFGLWNRYYRPTFEPKTVFYHTSTFGCLSEAHLYFDKFGPFIYGAIWAFICYWLYIIMIAKPGLVRACITSIMIFWIYYLERTGFLGINVSILMIYAFVSWILLRKTSTGYEEYELLEEGYEYSDDADLPVVEET